MADSTPPTLLFLSKGESAASTRYRASAFFPALEAAGYRPIHRSTRGGLAYQLSLLQEARRAAATVVLRRTFGAPFRLALRHAARRLVFDLDDAIYTTPRGPSPARRRGFGAMVRRSNEVWAGNDVLAAEAQAAGPRGSVRVVPTALDPTPYTPWSAAERDGKKLVWIGSSSTRPYLEAVLPELERAAARVPGLSLRIVADFSLESDVLPIEVKAWSSDTEAEDLAACGIGLGPLSDSAWTRGKCGFKLLQYMAAGLPTICNPVGANAQIVVDGQTGRHITPTSGWADAIETLCTDLDQAQAMGIAGRKRFDEHYALPHVASRIIERLNTLTR